MGVCSCTSKFIIIVINLIFWLGTAFFIYAGVAYLVSTDGVLGDVDYKPAYIVFAIATLLFLCGLAGMIGAFSEKKVFLGIFVFVVTGTMVLLVFVSATLFVKEDDAMNSTDTFVLKQFHHYDSPNLTSTEDQTVEIGGTNTTGNMSTTAAPATTIPTTVAPTGQTNSTAFIDSIQKSLHCCGWYNYTDWNHFDYWSSLPNHKNKVPYSCCNHTAADAMNRTCPTSNHTMDMKDPRIYTQNCKHEVDVVVSFVYKFLEWTAVAFCILVFLGFCSSVYLMCRKRRSDGFNYSSIIA
ncbi:tetraspanin-3-like [Styela clava]